MKNILRGTLIALFFVVGFGIVSFPSSASADTIVSGSIFSDQTWVKEGNPYHITSNTVVYPSVNLTVNDGVEVVADPLVYLEVRGKLNVIGTPEAPSRFSVQSNLEQKKWSGIVVNTNLGGSIDASFMEVSQANVGLSITCCNQGGPLKVADSIFRNNGTAIGGYGGSVRMTIERTLFEDNDRAITQADKDIVQSTFRRNTYGLYQTERINVLESLFEDNGTALSGGRGSIKYTTIRNNDVAVEAFYEGFSIQYSSITGNKKGITAGTYYNASPSLQYNNIHGNGEWNLNVKSQVNVDASHNWWGTTDLASIQATIVDAIDKPGMGLAMIDPILEVEISIEKPVEAPAPEPKTDPLPETPVEQPVIVPVPLPPVLSPVQPDVAPAVELLIETEPDVVIKRLGKGGVKGWIKNLSVKKGDLLVVRVSKGNKVMASYKLPAPKGNFNIQFDDKTKQKIDRELKNGRVIRYDIVLKNANQRLTTQAVFVRS